MKNGLPLALLSVGALAVAGLALPRGSAARASSRKYPRPKTRIGQTYYAYVGDRFMGTIGRMDEDKVLMDFDGRPYKIISLDAFHDWVAKMPETFWWEAQ